jgi:hypothetical protein
MSTVAFHTRVSGAALSRTMLRSSPSRAEAGIA